MPTKADPWADPQPKPSTCDHGNHRPGCLTAANCTPPSGWRTFRPDEWVRSLRPYRMSAAANSVALTLASFANRKDGKNARPGLDRLAWASKASVSTCQRALDDLQLGWLIYCAECGNGRGHAQVWWLTTHDVMDRRQEFGDWRER